MATKRLTTGTKAKAPGRNTGPKITGSYKTGYSSPGVAKSKPADPGAFARDVSSSFSAGVAAVGRSVNETGAWVNSGLSGIHKATLGSGRGDVSGAMNTGTMPADKNPLKRILRK